MRDRAKLLDYYRRSGALVVKAMEFDSSTLDELVALGVTIEGRVYWDDQSLAGTEMGRFIERVVRHARDYPQVTWWEGPNEDFQEGDDLARYAQAEIGRMRALEDVGRKAIIGNFSTGRPELADWPLFRPALEYAHAHGHALGLHEYSGPYMQWLAGENQWDWQTGQPRRIDDPCTDPTVEGWLTLRYRKAYRMFAEWGIGDLPLFITEGGIDDVQPRPGPQGKGYKDFKHTVWAEVPGIENYAHQRHWYMWQASHDRYVQGVVDFGWDTADPAWQSFDLSTDPAMLNEILFLEADLPVGHIGEVTPPEPPQPPVSTTALQPMIVVATGWTLADVARHAYPGQTSDAQALANARAIAAANGLDAESGLNPAQAWRLPRYLIVPGYKVVLPRGGGNVPDATT
jgi:hypothetical protein